MEVCFDKDAVAARAAQADSTGQFGAVRVPGTELVFWRRATGKGSAVAQELASTLSLLTHALCC